MVLKIGKDLEYKLGYISKNKETFSITIDVLLVLYYFIRIYYINLIKV